MPTAVCDARRPAKGVRVTPYVGPKIHGLSISQTKARRRIEGFTFQRPGEKIVRFVGPGVFQPQKAGGPTGLGMLSSAKDADNALRRGDPSKCPVHLNSVLPTRHAAPGTVRPGTRRRSPKPGPRNPVFCGDIPSKKDYERREGQRRLKFLRKIWIKLLRRGNPALEDQYESCRAALKAHHPNLIPKLAEIERIKPANAYYNWAKASIQFA